MIPHFSDKFAKGSWTEMLEVTDHSATLRRGFNEKTCQQYGAYRKRCAELICQAFKGSLIATPEKIHHLPPAMVQDRTCIANGDDWCEWEVAWVSKRGSTRRLWPLRRVHEGTSGGSESIRQVQPAPVAIGQNATEQRDDPALLSKGVRWLPWGTLSGIGVFAFLALTQPNLPLSIGLSAGIVATMIASLGASRLRRKPRPESE